MNILTVTGTFHPEVGGPPTYLYHLLSALVERGHEITVVTYGDVVQEFEYPYRVIRVSRRRSIPVRLFQFTRQVWRAARDCDLIFVNGYGLPPAVVNLWLCKPLVLKVVSDFAWEFCERHGWVSDPVLTFQARRYRLGVELIKAMRRWYVSRANQVIVPGNYVRELVRRWGIPEANIRVMYNAFHSTESIPSVTKNEARRELGLSDRGALLVTVGRLIPLKRVDWIIRAVASWENVGLVVVGDGPARQYLETTTDNLGLESRVVFAGRASQDLVLLYLRAADAFVLSSETEGFPHVILEAMAVGTPIVATAVGGVPELIEHERSGLLASPDDEMVLREQIQRVLTDRALTTRIVTYSQEKVLPFFSWDRLVDETEGVLHRLVGEQM